MLKRLLPLVLLFVCLACRRQQPLLNQYIDTVPEPEALHIAVLQIQPEDARQVDMRRCFNYEPGVEFYDSTETHRILRERNISAEGLADRRDLSFFKEMQDFTALILEIPRGEGVLLRSFRFQQERVVEGFLSAEKLNCEALYNWLNFLKVISFPDNAFIFADGKYYLGRTPRWVDLGPGTHLIRAETMEKKIAQETVKLPGKIQILLKMRGN